MIPFLEKCRIILTKKLHSTSWVNKKILTWRFHLAMWNIFVFPVSATLHASRKSLWKVDHIYSKTIHWPYEVGQLLRSHEHGFTLQGQRVGWSENHTQVEPRPSEFNLGILGDLGNPSVQLTLQRNCTDGFPRYPNISELLEPGKSRLWVVHVSFVLRAPT